MTLGFWLGLGSLCVAGCILLAGGRWDMLTKLAVFCGALAVLFGLVHRLLSAWVRRR